MSLQNEAPFVQSDEILTMIDNQEDTLFLEDYYTPGYEHLLNCM